MRIAPADEDAKFIQGLYAAFLNESSGFENRNMLESPDHLRTCLQFVDHGVLDCYLSSCSKCYFQK